MTKILTTRVKRIVSHLAGRSAIPRPHESKSTRAGREAFHLEAERALRLSEARLNHAQRLAKIGSWERDLKNDTHWWSDQLFEILEEDPARYKPSFHNFVAKVHPDDRHRITNRSHGFQIESREHSSVEARILLAGGREKYVHLLVEPLFDDGGRPAAIIGTLRDITARVRLEREIVTVSGREHERVGRDLHDSLGQTLTGISMSMHRLSEGLATEGSQHGTAARRISTTIQEAVVEVGTISRRLLPVPSVRRGFSRTLQVLAQDVIRDTGISCRVQCTTHHEVRNIEAATHLYRIAQEAVNNALKHGKAQSIDIRFGSDESGLLLEITDNGVGIPPEKGRHEGIGLKSMRFRIRMLHGELDVSASPHGGTRVFCSFPQSAIT
jgi:signal transduction histidine kinase